jgi:hypothetical protein
MAYTQEQKTAFVNANPGKFRGQLWERCRCGREPVNMPSHLCLNCLMASEDHPRIPGPRVPHHSVEPDGDEPEDQMPMDEDSERHMERRGMA